MNKHLQTTKRFLPFLIILFFGFVGTSNLFAAFPPEGALNGLFTVNYQGDQVGFSQGNLQYIGSASTPYWKFADTQWDYLGSTTGQNSSNQNVDRDLFGWGTSGYNHGATCYQPWSTNTTNSAYYAYSNYSYHLYDQTGQADWGYNAISNGGNTENSGWRTLTYNEWWYVFHNRSTPSGIRYAKAVVNYMNGVILLPDNWSASVYSLSNTNSSDAPFNSNLISASQWPILEQAGAVFLPAAGYRTGTSVENIRSKGRYWSSNSKDLNMANAVTFESSSCFPYNYSTHRSQGFSVRLVHSAVNYSFDIKCLPNSIEGGAVSGEGTYQWGAGCTLTATPSVGYIFYNWIENGTVVSTDADYTFTVSNDRLLIAVFVKEGNITFADANVKALCVANWDTNGDGELSYAEAANVTSIGNVFKNNTIIHSFNELQYFYGLCSIEEQAFYGCTVLTQIAIPMPVQSVGSKAFWNCPALQTVRFNAINCTSMQTTYNSNTYSVFSSNASGGTPAVKSVNIANGVTRIPDYAFKDCAQIYPGMTIRSSVTYIGAHAFENCSSMTTLSFQSNSVLTTIGDYAFYGCSALNKALNLPNSVTTLGQYAFYGCVAIPSLSIGTSMEAIGAYAFWNCPNLATVHFNATNCTSMETYSQSGYSVFNIGTNDGGATPIVTLNIGNNVTRIPDYAFRNSTNMTSVITIPDATTYIGQYAFYGTHSAELTIGESVATIGDRVFWNCPNLATVHFNATNCTSMVSNYQYSVFNSGTIYNGATPIVTLTIGNNVTRIPDYAFKNSSNAVGSLLLPNVLTYVGQYAFYGCNSITGDLVFPNTVTAIGQYAFYNCCGFNGTLTLPNNEYYNAIQQYAFYGCSGLTGTLTIPTNVTEIDNDAFYNCSGFSGSLMLHDVITSIGTDAFNGCSNITELTIGEGVTTIGGNAFWNCPDLATMHFNATNCTSMANNSGYSVFNTGASNNGDTPIVTLTIGDNVTSIPDYAFRNSTNMTSAITVPDATTYIGTYAFYGAYSTELTIGEGVTSFGGSAFWNCPNLATVHFNATNCTSMVTDSQYSVFNTATSNNGATPIVTLTIGDNVTRIPAYAFKNSTQLANNLIIPNSVTTIDQYAFAGCSGQSRTLHFGNGLNTIGAYAFSECRGFTGDLVIPNAVTSMGQYAFSGCSGFNGSLILGNGIQTINQNTFDGCTGFSGALILGTEVNDIKEYAFNNCSAVSLLITENADPITATSSSFTGMTYTIPVYVPDGLVSNYQNATGWNNFTNYIEQYTFWQELDTDNWSDELNWLSMELPGENDVVCIAYNCNVDIDVDVLHVYVYNINDVLTVKSGKILNTAYGIGVVQPSQLVMEDGSQLYNTIPGVCGTLKKTINGYGSGDNGWYTVASPIYGGTSASAIATGNYDLYGYDEPTHYWLNGENADNGITMMNPAQGYLYANQAGTTLNFAGQLNACNANVSIPITYTYSPLAGLNLVGNPFTCNAYLQDENDNPMPFFKMNDTGDALVAAQAGMPIKPCEGVFVFCPNDRQEHFAVFTTTAPANLGEILDVPNVLLPIHDLLVNQDACGAVSSVTQTILLSQGWNWISTYIEVDNPVTMLQMVEESLGENGLMIKSTDIYTENDAEWGWFGDLDEEGIVNEQMYKVLVSGPCTVTLEGIPANPADHTITINKGWNWIGFPSAEAISLDDAFANFAQEGDIIRNSDGETPYDPEWGGWFGDFETLEPGQGYMYYSTNSTPRTLVFPSAAK